VALTGRQPPGFEQILAAVVDAWKNRREMAIKQADELTGYLQNIEEQGDDEAPSLTLPLAEGRGEGAPTEGVAPEKAKQLLDNALRTLSRAFDARHGGFGSAPKFPHSMDLQLLLRMWKRQPRDEVLRMVTHTLDKMAAGGIYDHLAGGFARYSVDERWLVPHFEKMLYDNALLTSAYLDAFQATANEQYGKLADEICRYECSYMQDAAGGFHSTEDADSEGEEGKFYVWTPSEVKQILGEEAGERFCYIYDVADAGNFEHGQSILNLPKTIAQCAALKKWNLVELEKELAESRAKLLAVRDRRVRPGKDDKVLVSWNALMIDALARAGVVLPEPKYLIAAENAANFILQHLSRKDGRLLHTWRSGQAKLEGYLDDYSYTINAFVTLYEATFNERWIDEAVRLADILLKHFEDHERGGFFFTADDHEQLIARNKDLHDASVPSGNAMAATALIRLGKLTGNAPFLAAGGRTLAVAQSVMERSPTGAGQMLRALDLWRGPLQELVLIGGANETENAEVVSTIHKSFLPNSVFAYRPAATPATAKSKSRDISRSPQLEPLFTGRAAEGGQPTLYICENYACQAPIIGADTIRAALAKL
jgi:uncharacterized protein